MNGTQITSQVQGYHLAQCAQARSGVACRVRCPSRGQSGPDPDYGRAEAIAADHEGPD